MTWLSNNAFGPGVPADYNALNNLANDIRNWGGNVNGGGYTLSNVSIFTTATTMSVNNSNVVLGATTAPVKIKQTIGANALAITDGAGVNPKEISFGFNASGAFTDLEVQAVHQGVSFLNMILQKAGGNVGVGIAPVPRFHVYGHVGNEVARFQHSVGAANNPSFITIYSTNPNYWWSLGSQDVAGGGTTNGFAICERSGSGALIPRIYLHQGGGISLRNTPIHADNPAAVLGGLTANRVYRTLAGELREVV